MTSLTLPTAYFALSTRNLAAGAADNPAHSKEASPSCSGRWNANECESDRLDELHQEPLMSGVAWKSFWICSGAGGLGRMWECGIHEMSDEIGQTMQSESESRNCTIFFFLALYPALAGLKRETEAWAMAQPNQTN